MYDATFKIILFGDQHVGKESLTERFLTNLFESDSKMTIGVDFEVKSLVVDRQKVKLQVWDFGGEERFRFLLPTYVRGVRGGIFMYDITNYSSFAHLDDWLSDIKKDIGEGEIFPILVVGNNVDLAEEREVSSAEAKVIAKSRKVAGFIEISTKTGDNVENAFEALTRLMLNDYRPTEVEVNLRASEEIGLEEVKLNVYKYLELKSKINKQVIRATIIKAIKKSLNIAGKEKSWDEDIWSFAINLSKSIRIRMTPKTIYFK
jgi:small GTP-binding protein